MSNRYSKETYEANLELGDGSYLTMQISYFCDRSIYETEDVDDPEPVFFLDGKPISRENLPGEVTAEVVAQLINSSTRVPWTRDPARFIDSGGGELL